MPTLIEFVPLRQESIDTIRARIDAGVNAGLDPTDPRWRDTTPGHFFYDHTQAFALEAEFLWDYGSTELPASFFLPFSWGIYLDYWGELLDVPRNDAAAATGEVTFTNDTASGVAVTTGTEVAVPAVDVDADPLIYRTTAGGTVPASGTLTLPVEAVSTGSEFNTAAASISMVLSPVSGVTVSNATAITGGADVELDEPYKERLLLEFSRPRGGGTKADYISDALKNPSVGHVVVQPYWAGPGTVRVIVSDHNNDPVSQAVVDELQAYFDPIPADGEGAAPINATVTVATVSAVNATVAATITHESGFSLDGSNGTEATEAAITAAVQEYINSLEPGRDVQQSRVQAAILSVTGVYESSEPTINGVAGNLAIGPLEVASLAAVNLT
jgi:uncharacterized phage protein gp47/JayE